MSQSPIQKREVIFVLFGATGDLAAKKIVPALDRLSRDPQAPALVRTIAVSRRDWQASDFAAFIAEAGTRLSDGFLSTLSYAKVDVEGDSGYDGLARAIEKASVAPDREVYVYLSLAPQLHARAFESLVREGILGRGKGKLMIEKPFGTDERSARELDRLIASRIDESQLYRVDHYLGKGTMIALMDLHENTPDLGRMMSSKSVRSIRARMLESKGIDGRGASYDPVGAFRDVGQNHLLEMLAVATADLSCGVSWQEARARAIELLAPPAQTCDQSRRGQYEGYLREKGVTPRSKTETAFEVVASMSKGRLKGVPLILDSGKKMGRSEASIEIAFNSVPGLPLKMTFSLQPEQKIAIEYRDGVIDAYDVPAERDAYENVILAALRGSEREFVGRREVEALWRYADRVVACWDKVPLETYSAENPFKLGLVI